MRKAFLLVTNNSKAQEKYREHPAIGVEYLADGSYLDVLIRVRDMIHEGWHLMSHPQASNLKPNQCPWKTVLIAKDIEAQPFARDIEMIEQSISAWHKFTKGMAAPKWPESALRDFRTVDLSVVESALDSSLMQQLLYSGTKY